MDELRKRARDHVDVRLKRLEESAKRCEQLSALVRSQPLREEDLIRLREQREKGKA